MPFARWESFNDCKTEMMETGHTEESAKKICGAIQARAEKGVLLKAEKPMRLDVITKSDSELIVGGYATWELRDPEQDVITTQAQVNFLKKFFAEPPQFRNIMVKHGNFQIGTPLLNYHAPDGTEYYSHVNEVGTYLISKIRKNNWRSVNLIRKQILDGKLKMYSISGDPIKYETKMHDGEPTRFIYDIDPWEVTLCEKGVNPRAHVRILAKQGHPKTDVERAKAHFKISDEEWATLSDAEKQAYIDKLPERGQKVGTAKSFSEAVDKGECYTPLCKAECCTFITQWETRIDEDIKKYMRLHGVEIKEAGNGVWLKFPVVCKAFDPETFECKVYDDRPDICRNYPRHESPFIAKEKCSLLMSRMGGILAKQVNLNDDSLTKSLQEIYKKHFGRYEN